MRVDSVAAEPREFFRLIGPSAFFSVPCACWAGGHLRFGPSWSLGSVPAGYGCYVLFACGKILSNTRGRLFTVHLPDHGHLSQSTLEARKDGPPIGGKLFFCNLQCLRQRLVGAAGTVHPTDPRGETLHRCGWAFSTGEAFPGSVLPHLTGLLHATVGGIRGVGPSHAGPSAGHKRLVPVALVEGDCAIWR